MYSTNFGGERFQDPNASRRRRRNPASTNHSDPTSIGIFSTATRNNNQESSRDRKTHSQGSSGTGHSSGHTGMSSGRSHTGSGGPGGGGRGGSQGGNSHLSVRDYNRRISNYARRRDLNGALRTLDELDRTPKVSRNLFTYNAVINALVMCSQHARADEFWREMQDSGIEPNLVTFNTMLKSCFGGMDEDVNRAFRFLTEMEDRGISADRVTLNSLINACVSAGRVRDAQEVYEKMRQLDIEPDAYTFCTLAKQARHQCDVSMLDALLLHQLHHHTILQQRSDSDNEDPDLALQISPVAYNTIADAYIRCGYPARAINLLEKMRDGRGKPDDSRPTLPTPKDTIPVSPDVQTFNVRLKALREAGAPSSDAFATLEEMKTLELEADHITLLTLADLCCRREDMALAEGVLRAATNADVKEFEKGSQEWKNLCNGHQSFRQQTGGGRSRTGNSAYGMSHAKRNTNTGNHMQSHHTSNRRNANQPRNAKANAALFNALIRGYSSLDPPNVDAAVALYEEMRRFVDKYGFSWYSADSVTYTMLVDAFARVGDAEQAEKIICEMESAGRSNVVAYNAYLKANRGNGFKAALSVLDRMKKAGLRPDVVTYNTVIDFLSAEENGTQIAEGLVRVDMPRNGVRPDLLTFNTLIKGVARNRGNKCDASTALGAAYRWLRELQARGLKPDEFTYQSMVSACAAAGDAPRALEFFRKVEAERAKRVSSHGRSSAFSTNFSGHNSLRTRYTYSNGVSPAHTLLPRHVPSSPSSNLGISRSLPVHSQFSGHGDQTSADWMLLPHPAAYIALMRAFLSSNAKDGVDSVLLLRDEMIARGLELGRTGYTAVADAYAERGDFSSVEATLQEMRHREGLLPDQKFSPVHHCIRMKALCNAGRLDDAIAILPEVENADTAVFNVLIFACAKNRDMHRMISVLRSMEARQIEPDAITSRAMSSMMKNIARTLRTFNAQFYNKVAAFTKAAANGHADGYIRDVPEV
ncbi:unnamed protein product [Chondrus crispus]|uniref:Pentatricopeptide repeat-containing protein-mitochondrial domain-containing protein n=1 Tax=Chondrus crispus TaxID=2769 RepID=R7QDU6_CHOCR|nr:unnamed protein product [Chondrus crispus]CDF35933.1 unnamed protein product [Chondrus crispus]|eukprot:XP_005715752.1 unnamed protein product [Chondrus crispus]